MGHVGNDGRPFTAAEQERFEWALLLAYERSVQQPPPLTLPTLLDWHAALSAHHPRMHPGAFREGEITFGSFLGTPAPDVPLEIGAALNVHQEGVMLWTACLEVGMPPDADDVLTHATGLHAELLRIHPMHDGNGRLARLVQYWLMHAYGLRAPDYSRDRAAYYQALAAYFLHRDLHPLLTLSRTHLI